MMNYKNETQGKKFVIGVAIKTSNESGRFQTEVPLLWEKFYRENTADKIPHRKNKDLLAVYTDYEGDYTQPFTYIIGCEVTDLKSIPQGMVGVEIPSSSYAVFSTEGPFPQSMGQTWQAIWNSPLKRSYTTDFEVYGPDFNPQNNPHVQINIAVKLNN